MASYSFLSLILANDTDMNRWMLIYLWLCSCAAMAQKIEPHVICSTNEICIIEKSQLKAAYSNQVYHIPIVFHVFDPTSPKDRLTIEKAEAVVQLLNANFSGQHRAVDNVQSSFKSRIADCKIVFHLARKDPYGNTIDGVTYHRQNVKGDNPGSNQTLKRAINWNTGSDYSGKQRYLQVWVTYNVNSDDYGTGWCYLPDTDQGGRMAGPTYNHKFLGGGTDSSSDDVLTHEIGHYFGLSHTFGPSYTQCGDDGVDDTPETRCYTWECKKGDLCSDGLVNTENFMDYSGCTSMFTSGQAEVMRYWLNHRYRNNLWSDDNLKFTGIYDEIYVGIEDELESLVKIFPNPSDGYIWISGIQEYQAELYDVTGNKVAQAINEPVYYNVPGLYFLRITVHNTTLTKKIFIQ